MTPEIVRQYCRYGQLDVIQEKYSLMTRRVEEELLPVCRELGVSLQAYSPLEQGLLTGKVTMGKTYPEGDVRNNNPNFAADKRQAAIEMMESWKPLKEKYQCSTGNLTIAFTHRHAAGVHILCGARTPEQIRDNAAAMKIILGDDDVAFMEKSLADMNARIR